MDRLAVCRKLEANCVTSVASCNPRPGGDEGSACSLLLNTGTPVGVPDVEYPSSSPHVVAVGGTTLTGQTTQPTREITWIGGGGGYSTVEPAPSWQRTTDSSSAPSVAAFPTSASTPIPALDTPSSSQAMTPTSTGPARAPRPGTASGRGSYSATRPSASPHPSSTAPPPEHSPSHPRQQRTVRRHTRLRPHHRPRQR